MPTVLVVDDEPLIVSFLEKGLRRHQYASEAASSGELALEMARSNQFDLMLLDLGLPGISGLEVLAALRADNQEMPVIVVTAGSEEDCQQALALGANAYLQKPFRFGELHQIIQGFLP
ncbi:MAG: response regulator [Leptolyngbya sp. SIO1D8]|nr:response regulator [Leptolyngbya sp. SIO1D8]